MEEEKPKRRKSLLWRLFWFLGKLIGLVLLIEFVRNRLGREKCVCEGEEPCVCEGEEEKGPELQ